MNFRIHMFLKCAVIFLCLVLIDIHHEGAEKSVVASVKGPKKAYRRILWLRKREQKFFSYLQDSAFTAVKRDATF